MANSSAFLTGQNDRGWKADFDFLMRIDKATAILEGKYSTSDATSKFLNEQKRTYEEKDLTKFYAN